MEYYSGIKRNTFESVPMRWINLKPIILSEVSQKEKISYIKANIWNLEIWHWWAYLQGSMETQRTDLRTQWGKQRVGPTERAALTYMALCCAEPLSRVQLWDPVDCSPLGSSVHGDSPGKNPGVGCYALLQGIFLAQGLNPGLLSPLAGRFFCIFFFF